MNILYILLAILVLDFIIVIHELGHYTVGRLCGLGIEEFSVGMGPAIAQWGKTIKYSIRAIPIGGFVRFTGEDEESSDPKAFNNGPVWKRFLTIFAGPFMNFVLALAVTVAVVLALGVYDTVPKVGQFTEGIDAASYGLMADDRLAVIDGVELPYTYEGYELMTQVLADHAEADPEKPLDVTVERAGERISLSVPLTQIESEDGTTRYVIGIIMGNERQPMAFGESITYSFQYMVYVMKAMLTSLRNLIFKGEGVEDMAGTVGIVSIMSQGMRQGVETILNYIILISLNLGIVNLLPLPALDGGRLVFLLIEAIRRKPLPRDKEAIVHLIGLALLMVLFVVLTYKDIVRILHGGWA